MTTQRDEIERSLKDVVALSLIRRRDPRTGKVEEFTNSVQKRANALTGKKGPYSHLAKADWGVRSSAARSAGHFAETASLHHSPSPSDHMDAAALYHHAADAMSGHMREEHLAESRRHVEMAEADQRKIDESKAGATKDEAFAKIAKSVESARKASASAPNPSDADRDTDLHKGPNGEGFVRVTHSPGGTKYEVHAAHKVDNETFKGDVKHMSMHSSASAATVALHNELHDPKHSADPETYGHAAEEARDASRIANENRSSIAHMDAARAHEHAATKATGYLKDQHMETSMFHRDRADELDRPALSRELPDYPSVFTADKSEVVALSDFQSIGSTGAPQSPSRNPDASQVSPSGQPTKAAEWATLRSALDAAQSTFQLQPEMAAGFSNLTVAANSEDLLAARTALYLLYTQASTRFRSQLVDDALDQFAAYVNAIPAGTQELAVKGDGDNDYDDMGPSLQAVIADAAPMSARDLIQRSLNDVVSLSKP